MKLIFASTLFLSVAWFATSPAFSQDVWLKGNLSLWLLAPQGEGEWSRMGRDSFVAFDANLPKGRTFYWSSTFFDFPNKKGGAVEQFYLAIKKGSGKTELGRLLAPFGAEGMEKYDKYVEPNDPSLVKNPFLDSFGDGLLVEREVGQATVSLSALNLALDGNNSPDLFARVKIPLGMVDLGLSHYHEAGGPDSTASEADLEAHFGPLKFIGETITGKPLGEKAKANFVAFYLSGEPASLFFKYGTYDPEAGPTAFTKKIGFERPLPLFGSLRLWWQGNKASEDQVILDFRFPL